LLLLPLLLLLLPAGTLLIPQEPFELLVRRSIGRLESPSLSCKVSQIRFHTGSGFLTGISLFPVQDLMHSWFYHWSGPDAQRVGSDLILDQFFSLAIHCFRCRT
jgi:hypothetical protein